MLNLFDHRRLALLLAFYALGISLLPVAAGVEQTVEDGFYYLKIAGNLARGADSTFDGGASTRAVLPLAPAPVEVPCAERLELLWLEDRYHPAWSVRAYAVRSPPAGGSRR